MDSFVPSIIALRNAKPPEVLASLHRIFSQIADMGSDEVVAAYQTLWTTAEVANMTQDFMVRKLSDALIAQMHHIVSRQGYTHINRFNAVTGQLFRR